MYNSKRCLALILSLGIVVFGFSGCGKTGQDTSSCLSSETISFPSSQGEQENGPSDTLQLPAESTGEEADPADTILTDAGHDDAHVNSTLTDITDEGPAVPTSSQPEFFEPPITAWGELAFQYFHAYGVDETEPPVELPGGVCKSLEQLERLMQLLTDYPRFTQSVLESYDQTFFEDKALLVVAAETEHGDSCKRVHKVTRGENGVVVSTDYPRSGGLPGPYRVHTSLFVIEVAADAVSVHDAVWAVHEPYSWIDEALPEGKRLAAPGRLILMNWKESHINEKEIQQAGLDKGLFRSPAETDRWLTAVEPYLQTDSRLEKCTLAEQVDALAIDYNTTALAVTLFTSYSEDTAYLGAAVTEKSVCIGAFPTVHGCEYIYGIPFIALQPVPLSFAENLSDIIVNVV